MQAFACCTEMLKGRLSTLATDAKGLVLRQGRPSTSACDAKGYVWKRCEETHDKTSICDNLGGEQFGTSRPRDITVGCGYRCN